MCVDKLSHIIVEALDNGSWKVPRAGKTGPFISHQMFVDDLLLFGEATEDQMKCVVDILTKFCNMAGQQVSNEKTSIFFSANATRGLKEKLVRISGFKETNMLGKYLGIPLTGRAPRKQDFAYIIEQLQAKLMHWKANQIALAGRVTLAKSVLEAIPIYPMMTTISPKSCIDEIHRIQRRFIWGDIDQSRSYHVVSWDTITIPRKYGELGLRRLKKMNESCILKTVRKLQKGSKDLWSEVLIGKYKFIHTDRHVEYKVTDSHLRKSIAKLWHRLYEHSWWSIGNGNNIDICQDVWIEEGLRLADCNFQIPEHIQGAKLSDLVTVDGEWNWRALNNWLPVHINMKIAAIKPPKDENGEDMLMCMNEKMVISLFRQCIMLYAVRLGWRWIRLGSIYGSSKFLSGLDPLFG